MEEQVKVRKMKELKNGRSRILGCNYAALESIVLAKGFKMFELAELMGYDKSYFNKVRHRGAIGETCVKLLKERYGILPQQYDVQGYGESAVAEVQQDVRQKVLNRLKKSEPETPQLINIQVTIDTAQLTEIVKNAVLDAFNSL